MKDDFYRRKKEHDKFVAEVKKFLEYMGLEVADYGVECVLPQKVRNILLAMRDEDESKMLRHQPDLVVAGKRIVLCDPKSRYEHNENVALQLEAIDHYCELSSRGLPVFIVVPPMQACWATEVVYKRKFPNAQKYKKTGGSGTPFGLLDEERSNLLPLYVFLQDNGIVYGDLR